MSSFDAVRSLICEVMSVDKSRVFPETRLEDVGVDSLGRLELAMSLEKELGVFIDDDQVEQFQTVRDVYEFADMVKTEKGL